MFNKDVLDIGQYGGWKRCPLLFFIYWHIFVFVVQQLWSSKLTFDTEIKCFLSGRVILCINGYERPAHSVNFQGCPRYLTVCTQKSHIHYAWSDIFFYSRVARSLSSQRISLLRIQCYILSTANFDSHQDFSFFFRFFYMSSSASHHRSST